MNKTKETLYQRSTEWDKFYQTAAYADLTTELTAWLEDIDRQLMAELTTKFGRSSEVSARLLAGNKQTLIRLLDFVATRAEELRREYAASDEPNTE